MSLSFEDPFKNKLIYVFEVNDNAHRGLLKIGETTISTDKKLQPNSNELNNMAHKRIKEYTNTAGLDYNLIYTELALKYPKKGSKEEEKFSDVDVHTVLKNSGIFPEKMGDTTAREWFKVNLKTVKEAINAVKKNEENIKSNSKDNSALKIDFRPEQEDAINKTVKFFKNKKNKRMLWNAKMRFGKTLCALEVVRQCKFKKTLIITHRPVVDFGWFDDFKKIFKGYDYYYGSKKHGNSLEKCLKEYEFFVYFSSIQDLRGSKQVGGKYDKNDLIFSIDWDLLIVDEAHEGTKTVLGNEVIINILKETNNSETKLLALSGTPFNIIDEYEEDAVYTWDYIMEQESKSKWNKVHLGSHNPYEELPEMKIYTYDLGNSLLNSKYVEFEDKAFNFHEFFRTWTGNLEQDHIEIPNEAEIGDFVHESDVNSFLNLITSTNNSNNYPFGNEKNRNLFKHTLWKLPGIREARALSKLMHKHPIFGNNLFNIVNVAGDGDKEEENKDALSLVKDAIINAGDYGYTITLSCGKLTTGVTIKEWTAVLMLAGSSSTSVSNYLQTIFRVQSPCIIQGKIKTQCYVFDFAPDRTLKMIAGSVAISTKVGKQTISDRNLLGKFLNYCPVISVKGTDMKKYDTNKLLQHLKRAYAERALKNGFDDINLYNDELLKLQSVDLEKFKELKEIIGKSKNSHKTNNLNINDQGFTDEEYEKLVQSEKKSEELSQEEQELYEKLKKQKKQKRDAISILRGISIRMPLLIYGAQVDFNEDFKLEMFLDDSIVDKTSWREFMPTGVTKELFNEFIEYYDPDVFVAAGNKIRNITKNADSLLPLERINKISELFSYFKNPDKETVLTPWNIVNLHLSNCLGGYSFYDDFQLLNDPVYVNNGNVTDKTFNNNSRILEINSKTGLYPLYITYTIFQKQCDSYSKRELTSELQRDIWFDIVKNNLFIICKTSMAKYITKRTLVGFNDKEINAEYFDNLTNILTNKSEFFIETVLNPKFWDLNGDDNMKFDAIVGNPPYHEVISSEEKNKSLAKQLFPHFVMRSIDLNSKYVSLITPARWFSGDAQDKSFKHLREFLREHNHISKIYYFENANDIFDNVEIKGGIDFFLYEKDYNGQVDFYICNGSNKEFDRRDLFVDDVDIILSDFDDYEIIRKVKLDNENFVSFMKITTGRNAFNIIGKEDNVTKISKEHFFDGCAMLRCKGNEIRYINPNIVTKNEEIFKNFKVFISKSAGGPTDRKVIGKPYLGEKNSACTDSLIPIGCFDSIEEARNLQKYLKTKFLRYLVNISKSSQNVTQIVYKLVPLENFSENSDINWNTTIFKIDEQLFNKYHLDKNEKNKINESIDYIKE